MIVSALVLLASAQTAKIYEPKVGSKERKALMDVLRKSVVPKTKQTVVFKVSWLRSNGSTAFLTGQPTRPDGKALDYKRTIYADAIRNGAFDDNISALFRVKKGKWIVDEWQIGATDVPWDGLWTRKKLPRGLFPGPG